MDRSKDIQALEEENAFLKSRIEELEKKNFNLNRIIDNLPFGIQLFDQQGISQKINRVQKDFLGISDVSQGVGSFNVLTDPFSVAHGVNKLYEKAYNGEQVTHQFEYNFNIDQNKWNTRKDKAVFSETIIPVLNELREVELVMAVLADVTTQVETEKLLGEKMSELVNLNDKLLQLDEDLKSREKILSDTEERFSIAFNFNPVAMIISGIETGKILDANQSYEKLFGFTRDELVGNSAVALRIYESAENRREIVDEIKVKKQLLNREVILYTKTGEKKNCLFSAELISFLGEKEQYLYTILFDITDLKEAEKALRESEERYRTLIDVSLDAIILNTNNEISYLNKSALKLLGAETPEQIVGKSPYEIFHSDFHGLIKHRIKSMLNKGVSAPLIEEKVVKLDGTLVDVEVAASPYRFKNNQTILVILRDISERKRVMEALKENQFKLKQQNEEYLVINEELNERNLRIQEINENMLAFINKLEKSEADKSRLLERLNEAQEIGNIGSWDWNIQTGEVWWSDELFRIFDVDPQQYVPSFESNAQFVHPDDTEGYHSAALRCMEKGDFLDYDLRIITPRGVVKNCKSTGKVYFDHEGKPTRFAGSFADITNLKNMYFDLLKAKEKAEESDRLKSAFLANMSHEIRTPMNAIIGFSEFLLRPDLSEEKRNRFANIIKERSFDLLRIVEDILDISKIEVGQMRISEIEVNIPSLLRDIHDFYYQKIKIYEGKENIKLTLNMDKNIESLIITSDSLRLRQILGNLLDNAIKFTNSGEIELGCRLNKSSELLFYVKDSGIGIAPDKKSIIFDRFRQAEDLSTSRKYGGSGLGLSIVKGLVDLMKGSIWVDSEINKGAIFFIRIPVNKSHENLGKANINREISHNREKSLTILVVEDDVANTEYLKELLEGSNFNVLYATTGAEALTLLIENPSVCLVLMDIRLPDINGLELTKQVKILYPHLIVIAQTAYAAPADMKACFEAGCTDYISKPINSHRFLQCLYEYTGEISEVRK
jgi:PAS domain S-box-containing protein